MYDLITYPAETEQVLARIKVMTGDEAIVIAAAYEAFVGSNYKDWAALNLKLGKDLGLRGSRVVRDAMKNFRENPQTQAVKDTFDYLAAEDSVTAAALAVLGKDILTQDEYDYLIRPWSKAIKPDSTTREE